MAVSDTCLRFRSVALAVYPINYGKLALWYESDVGTFMRHTSLGWACMEDIEIHFEHFGSRLVELELRHLKDKQMKQIFRLILTYCADSLASLIIPGFHFDTETFLLLKEVTSNLKSLALEECKFDDKINTSLLSGCKNLNHLDLAFITGFSSVIFGNCPQLNCLKLIHEENDETEAVIEFLKRQRKLQQLTFIIGNDGSKVKYLDVIADY